MTVIDELVALLKLDNKDFIDKSKMSKEELQAFEKQAKATADKLQAANDKVAGFASGLRGYATSLLAYLGIHEVKSYANEVAEADRETGRLAKNLGMAVGELDAWQKAAYMADGSAEAFRASIKGLAGNLVDIEKGLPRAKRALVVFSAAGITGLAKGKHADVMDILNQLSDKMQKMNSFEAGRLGARLGLDSGTIRLLRQGRDSIAEVREEMKELGVMSQNDVDSAEELEDAQKKLEISTKAVGRNIVQVMLPAMTWFADKMLIVSKWCKEHGDLVKATFVGLAVAVSIAGAAALAAAPPIIAVSWPVLAIAAAVGALAAGTVWLIQKWKEWVANGKETTSALGKMFSLIEAQWNRIKTVVMTVLSTIWDLVKRYVGIIIDYWSLLFAILSGDKTKIREAWNKLMKDLAEFFKIAFNFIMYYAGVWAGTIVRTFQEAWSKAQMISTAFFEWLKDQFKLSGMRGAESFSEAFQISLKRSPLGFLMKLKEKWDASPASEEGAPAGLLPSGLAVAGAPALALAGAGGVNSRKEVHIGELNVLTQADNADAIAGDIKPAVTASFADDADWGVE